MNTDILNQNQVAELLDCDAETVLAMARDDRLPGVKFGRSWVFPRIALIEAVNQMARTSKRKTAIPKATVRTPVNLRRVAPPELPASSGEAR